MNLKLLWIMVLFQFLGLGVFFMFFIGALYAGGGVATIDMTSMNEAFAEYIYVLILAATGPYALYKLDPKE